MTEPSPLVHIILVTWNHWSVTAECLAQLVQLGYTNYHIVVVDNGSTDTTPDTIETLFPTVTLLRNTDNLGFAAGCNIGLRHVLAMGADYVLLLNNDTIPSLDLISRLVAAAGSLPDAGILTPIATYADAPQRWWPTAGFCHRLTSDYVRLHPEQLLDGRPLPVNYVFGTAMFLRRPVLEQVGLLDERYFMYYEDMDYCLRAARAGWELYVLPDIHISHHVEASTEEDLVSRQYFKARSSVIFFRSYGSGAYRPLITIYRLGCAVKRVTRLLWQHQFLEARAYLRGLWHGIRYVIKDNAKSTL
ncbi:MAG: glycosyltransferase family 2 protein [Desulfocapsa sp.]|nr:glycosyltransferase family 2 protein [Desulfocapsa sp.]